MDPTEGWFSIVQYCPDSNRLEPANIGVLLFCPTLDFLEVKMLSDNLRITRFFDLEKFELDAIETFKEAMVARVENERAGIVSYECLVDFIDRRANMIRVTPPRSIRVKDPVEVLCKLAGDFLGSD